MQAELPEFEGRKVQAGVARFSGKVVERVGALHDGEFAIIIAKVRVNKIQHTDFQAKSGANQAKLYSRIHDCVVTKAVLLEEKDGIRMLEEASQFADEKFGVENLWSSIEKPDNDELREDIEPAPERNITDDVWDEDDEAVDVEVPDDLSTLADEDEPDGE